MESRASIYEATERESLNRECGRKVATEAAWLKRKKWKKLRRGQKLLTGIGLRMEGLEQVFQTGYRKSCFVPEIWVENLENR